LRSQLSRIATWRWWTCLTSTMPERYCPLLGGALGKLPAQPHETTKEQEQFLTKALAGLAQDKHGHLRPPGLVRQMMKNRPWTPAALAKMGGAEGPGSPFWKRPFPRRQPIRAIGFIKQAARAVLSCCFPKAEPTSRPPAVTGRAAGGFGLLPIGQGI